MGGFVAHVVFRRNEILTLLTVIPANTPLRCLPTHPRIDVGAHSAVPQVMAADG